MANDRMRAWLTRPGGLAAELVAARGSLSMRQLADLVGQGWGSAKISKLEHGQQLPTDGDLDAIAAALMVDKEQRQAWQKLLIEALGKRASFSKRRPITTGGPDNLTLTLEADAGFIRATGPYLLPDLLQTKEYAYHALRSIYVGGMDAGTIAKQIIDRQEILSDLERAFQFVIPESALRTLPAGPSIMAGQYDRLISAATMRNVQVAILPLNADVIPLYGAVTVYDSDAVIDDGIELRHYGPAESGRIVERMDELWEAALRGDEARKLILAAAADLQNLP